MDCSTCVPSYCNSNYNTSSNCCSPSPSCLSCPPYPTPLPTYQPCVPILPPGCKPPTLPPWERYCVSYSHVSGELEEHPCKYTHMLGIRNRNKFWKVNNDNFQQASGIRARLNHM